MPSAKTGDGGSIAYAKLGEGPTPVLFLHGWLVSGTFWQPVAEALPPDRYTSFLPDLRGTGFSFQPETGYTLDRFAEDMIGLLSEEKTFTGKWIVVGHGFGALIAQRLATLYARRVGGLVLFSPFPMAGLKPAGEWGSLLGDVACGQSQAGTVFPRLFAKPPSQEELDVLLEDAESASPLSRKAVWDISMAGGDGTKLAKVRAPTLVVASGKDALVSPDTGRMEVAGKISGTRFEIWDDLGHFAPLEAPGRVAERIHTFISGLAAAG